MRRISIFIVLIVAVACKSKNVESPADSVAQPAQVTATEPGKVGQDSTDNAPVPMRTVQKVVSQGHDMPPDIDDEEETRNRVCVNRHRYTAATRRMFYPFNKAAEVRLVSFDPRCEPIDTNSFVSDIGYKRLNYVEPCKTDMSVFDENVILSGRQIDSLTDIIFNQEYKGKVWSTSLPCCFSPLNAVLFLDANGTVFDYISICFQCHAAYSRGGKVSVGIECMEKYTLLRSFFLQCGIIIGPVEGGGGDQETQHQ